LQLTIEKLIYGGDGLAHLPPDDLGRGKAVFVPFTLEGERVEASIIEEKPGFSRARADEWVSASALRIQPSCPHFTRCGGCHYQHAGYEPQLEVKAAILRETLKRIAKVEIGPDLEVHPSPPWGYRNRVRLQLRSVPEFLAGFFKFGSHEVLAIEQCPISSPLLNRAISALWQTGREHGIPEGMREIEFFVDAADANLLVEIYGNAGLQAQAASTWVGRLQAALPEMRGGVVFQAESDAGFELKTVTQSGTTFLDYRVGQAMFRVSAGSFFQVNRHMTERLVTVVTAEKRGRTVVDMYAGAGLFSAPLGRSFERVIAVEPAQASHADLVRNVPPNVKAVRATAEQYMNTGAARQRADAVVVDPPRSGLGQKVVRGLVNMQPARITYVSCDPATLARDLAGLLAGSYRISRLHLVDLFPQTFHMESVVELERQP
jgi:23S rRNA (uracil1939-C5)-methyltransferase